jgi:predicted permease
MSRCRALFRGRRLNGELDEELLAHIDLAIEENLRAGMNPEQARTAALRAFGGVTQTREAYRIERGFPLLEQAGRDLRFALRQLRRSPAFAATAILTLALGLGANTAVFSLINAVLLRPLPVPHNDELAFLEIARKDDGDRGPNTGFPEPILRALEKRHDAFEHTAAFTEDTQLLLRGSSGTQQIKGSMVSGEFFAMMEVQPLLGRVLTPADDQKGGGATGYTAVISEGFWRQWFGASPNVIGSQLTIANTAFTVVGVMPRSFKGADLTRNPSIYVPLWSEPVIDAPISMVDGGYHAWWLNVMARRKAGVSLEQANAALAAASNAIIDENALDARWVKDAHEADLHLLAESGARGYSDLRMQFAKPLMAVFVLCAVMLLLACLNLASLLMARAASRERELATRLALGASRRRLIRQLMVESLLIATLGTIAGIAAAPIVSRALAALMTPAGDISIDTTLDWRVFAFVALTAVGATFLIGLMPALRSTGKELSEQIKSGAQNATKQTQRRLLPRVLMGLEVALALMLVAGAGLLATSLARLYSTGLGYDPNHVVSIAPNTDKQPLEGDALLRWYHDYQDALAHQPGVESAALANDTPMDGSITKTLLHDPMSGKELNVFANTVGPGYFHTLRVPLLAGREFNWNDTLSGGTKTIISESLARHLFPNGSAVGQHLSMGQHAAGQRASTREHAPAADDILVVGVVGDLHIMNIREQSAEVIYHSTTQSHEKKPSYFVVVRVNGSAVPLASASRQIAARMAPEIPPPAITTLSGDIDNSIASERMMAMLSIFFAGCALLVTGIGLYGTLSYATARRTSEIGIRMALGAQRAQVVGMVFRENAWIAACGSAAGLTVALFAAKALASFLYGTSVHDPWVLAGSVAALALIASTASLLPALRAALVDPMRALRTE